MGGVFLGALLATALAVGAVPAASQDSTAVMQLQQQVNSLRLELSNRMSTMEIDIDRIERQQLDLQNRILPLENDLRQLAISLPSVPAAATTVSAKRIVPLDTGNGSELRLYDALGNLRVLLSASAERGELVLFDSEGNETFRR
jgi:hypothetical protein